MKANILIDKIRNKINQVFFQKNIFYHRYHYTFRPSKKVTIYPIKNIKTEIFEIYDFEFDRINKEIGKNKPKTIGVQIPEGLRSLSFEISNLLHEKYNSDIYISLEPCFGACDIKYNHFKELGISTIIHFGNVKIPNLVLPKNVKVIFVPLYIKSNPIKMIEIADKYLRERHIKKLGLVSSIQMIKNIKLIEEELKKKGFQVFIGKGNSRVSQEGHVLGCNSSSAISIMKYVDVFIMFEDGSFHAKSVSLSTQKDVICFDPLLETVFYYSYKELNKIAIEEASINLKKGGHINNIGILVSSKPGQNRSYLLKKLIKLLTRYKVSILTSDYLDINTINKTNYDLIISTICPRVTIDERSQFNIPILTIPEAITFFPKKSKTKKLRHFVFDQIN